MSTILITAFVILWLISAINSVRKAVAKAQAAAGGPGAIQAAVADAAAQSEAAARTAASQRAARALRMRMQAAVAGGPGAVQALAPSPAVKSTPMPAYVAPPADQPMTSLIDMAAPSMPTFDAPGFDAGLASLTGGLLDSSSSGMLGAAAAGRQIFLTEGATAGAAAIVASAIIGPPVGLRPGNLSASDW